MLITKEKLVKAVPTALLKDIEKIIVPLNQAAVKYDIVTPIRIASFISQIAHESKSFSRYVENLNYRAGRLMEIFPKRFNTMEIALKYEHKPVAIANRVYANRYGNGDELSGDGWFFRGRGLMHHTFKDNFEELSDELNHDYVKTPNDLLLPSHACFAACYYWKSRKCNTLADQSNFEKITVVINGGLNGYEDREKHWEHVKKIFT